MNVVSLFNFLMTLQWRIIHIKLF